MVRRHVLVVLLAAVLVPGSASSQLPSLKKLKDAARNAAKPAATAPAAPADSARDSLDTAGPRRDSAKVATRTDPTVWENYDFVPGSRVILYTDFSDDRVGNFSRRLKYKSGSMDVVERDGVRMLRATSRAEFLIPLGRALPERFTLELDILAPYEYVQGHDLLAFEGGPSLDRGDTSAEINWNTDGTVIIGGGQTGTSSSVKLPHDVWERNRGKLTHLRVLMDGAYFKLYVNEHRLYNIPELGFKRDSVIRVAWRGSPGTDGALYIAQVRVAESEIDVLYDALAATGRWMTQGILFATGKADLQPESTPVLKEIAATLKEHPDLKILIEGHTDNVGQPAANLVLSDARAAAVKAALVADFGIAADRIQTKGLGDTRPTVPNTTPEGRAQNRRVEVVKQ